MQTSSPKCSLVTDLRHGFIVSFQNEAPGDSGLRRNDGKEAKVSSNSLGVSVERQDTAHPGQDNRGSSAKPYASSQELSTTESIWLKKVSDRQPSW